MSSRRGTYVTDLRDFLNEHGDLPVDLATPALNLALHIASIVAWVTNQRGLKVQWTNVPCRRRPGRRRCSADILAVLESNPTLGIRWWCPACEDNGVVYGWEDSLWDRGVWSERPGDTH